MYVYFLFSDFFRCFSIFNKHNPYSHNRNYNFDNLDNNSKPPINPNRSHHIHHIYHQRNRTSSSGQRNRNSSLRLFPPLVWHSHSNSYFQHWNTDHPCLHTSCRTNCSCRESSPAENCNSKTNSTVANINHPTVNFQSEFCDCGRSDAWFCIL